MATIDKAVFISYRRTNIFMARAVYQELTQHNYDCFLDMERLDSGDFEQVIVENIKSRAHFIVILTPSALDRCNETGDWLRREIETAIDSQRNIIPLLFESFDFSDPNIKKNLTSKLELLTKYNALRVPSDYFEEAMYRLRNRFLNRELAAIIHPRSTYAQEASDRNQQKAQSAGDVTHGMLEAEFKAEQSKMLIDRQDYELAIEKASQAIMIKPEYYLSYAKRGLAYYHQRLYAVALQDFDKAISLEPNFSEAYNNRGNIFYALGNYQRAIEDFSQAMHLEESNINSYINRASAFFKINMLDEAKADLELALIIDPEDELVKQNMLMVLAKLEENEKTQ